LIRKYRGGLWKLVRDRNLKAHLPGAISTDLFANPWLDLACDGYDLPFKDGSLSHLVLFDVFHHLRARTHSPRSAPGVDALGRIVLFEPYISWSSFPVYGLLHHEPVAWRQPSTSPMLCRVRAITTPLRATPRASFFAAKFRAGRRVGWSFMRMPSAVQLSPFRRVQPARALSDALPAAIQHCDQLLSRGRGFFGARCLVGLQRV